MEFIEEIITELETQSIGIIGTDLFRGFLPDEPNDAMMVISTGGEKPSTYLPIRNRSVQVTVRGASYEWAENKINEIYIALHKLTQIGTLDVMQVSALQEPTNIGKDDSKRTIFTCNFIVKTRTV